MKLHIREVNQQSQIAKKKRFILTRKYECVIQ